MRLKGGCHCGNLGLEFETGTAPAELPLRACQCTFCRAHGVLSVSDPKGSVSVSAGDAALVQRYRFGLGVTDFLICRRCGVYLLAMVEQDGERYAVINANVLERRGELSGLPQPMDYGGEDAAARLARRKTRWTPIAALKGL
ncbi:MAG: GFA family protein [Bacillota bacterium]